MIMPLVNYTTPVQSVILKVLAIELNHFRRIANGWKRMLHGAI